MKASVFDVMGKKTGTITLPGAIFGRAGSPQLLSQVIKGYQANQRQGTKKVKRRGEVAGSGRKIWRQKGTGRARHGDRYAPLFVGGGRAHGPTGAENYRQRLPVKMRRLAIRAALAWKAKQGKVIVVDGWEKRVGKTTQPVRQLLEKLVDYHKGDRVTVITAAMPRSGTRGVNNLAGVMLKQWQQLNAYEVLRGGNLIFSQTAVEEMK